MRKNNTQEAKRFLLSYVALNQTEKTKLLCNMIAIYAGKFNITTKEKEYINEILTRTKEILNDGIG